MADLPENVFNNLSEWIARNHGVQVNPASLQEAFEIAHPHRDTKPAVPAVLARRRCDERCIRPTPTQAHCGSGCHVTFGGVAGFDSHRRNGQCLDPANLGMVDRDGVWRRTTDRDAAAIFRPMPDTEPSE